MNRFLFLKPNWFLTILIFLTPPSSQCIEKYIRVRKKECPKCRMHCSSKRSLRPDKRFDCKKDPKRQKPKLFPAFSHPTVFVAKDLTLLLQHFVGDCVVISAAFFRRPHWCPVPWSPSHRTSGGCPHFALHYTYCILYFTIFSHQPYSTGKHGFWESGYSRWRPCAFGQVHRRRTDAGITDQNCTVLLFQSNRK